MKMDVPPSTVRYTDDDNKNLKLLLDVFSPVVSFEDIDAAYCKAGRDPTIAGDILGDLQASTSNTFISSSEEKIEDSMSVEEVGDSVTVTSESVSGIYSGRADPTSSKQKKYSLSTGTVSSMIPRDYVTKKPLVTENYTREKPLKLSADDLFTSEIRDEKAPLGAAATSETLPGSVEELLFNMLGNGFSLDRSVIEDVVGQCGYDLNKSMDRLLDMSASTLERSDDILNTGVQNSVENPDHASVASLESQETTLFNPATCSEASTNRHSLSKREKERSELQKEVMQSLFDFNVPSRFAGAVEVTPHLTEAAKPRGSSRSVAKPLQETVPRQVLIRAPLNDAKNGEEDGESYEVLQKAMKEYFNTMKEYYKAAGEAFLRGDHDKVQKCMEEGQFFMSRACQARDRSAELLLEKSENKEDLTLDLHDYAPKDAVRVLKIHLKNICGISSIQYVKILVGSTVEEANGPRKRLVIKLLERGSIAWTEDENGMAIMIKADEIDPTTLSFAKK